MTIETSVGEPLSAGLLKNYFRNLVNQVYKILPMREKEAETIRKYIWRLEAELVGFRGLTLALREDAYYGNLIGTISYLSEHVMDCTPGQVKQLVFECISLCGKLSDRYAGGDD